MEVTKMTRVVVTGGAGFIGSNIVDLMIENGYEVAVIDNLSSGNKKNLNDDATFYELDICNPGLMEIFEKENPEFVIHQAAQIDVRKSITDPVFDANVNVLGSINILECCRKSGVKKIVYASSGGAIYGEPEYLPADENHPIRPICPYGVSKHVFEHYLYLYMKNFGLDYTALRYANVYGPRQDPFGEAGVIAIFIGKLLANETYTINGDGEQTRDFVFAGDIAMANLLAIEKKTTTKEFNIGSGVETSVNEISRELCKIIGSDAEPIHGDAILGEVQRIYLDSGLAKKELGWESETSLGDGLRKTIRWFENSKGQ